MRTRRLLAIDKYGESLDIEVVFPEIEGINALMIITNYRHAILFKNWLRNLKYCPCIILMNYWSGKMTSCVKMFELSNFYFKHLAKTNYKVKFQSDYIHKFAVWEELL